MFFNYVVLINFMSDQNQPIKKIARILRAEPENIEKMFKTMEELTGVKDVPEKLVSENKKRMDRILNRLNVSNRTGEEVFNSLKYHIKRSNHRMLEFFDQPTLSDPATYNKVIAEVKWLSGKPKGFFLKKKKAEEMLHKAPPENMINAFNYSGVDELLEKEDLFEVYSALRFMEPRDWMNEKFLPQYEELTPDDFVEREVQVLILPHKWLNLARDFIEKKYHNLSHLKEMGVVFVIPIEERSSGSFLRLFALLLHYMHEIPFYSRLFEKYAEEKEDFSSHLIESLQGKVLKPDEAPEGDKIWLIVQRYLAKDDKQDPRLFMPHVNPEALHWQRGEDDIADFAEKVPQVDLDIWRDLDWVGDYYPSSREGEVLVSFDLIDNVMSLVMEEELIKYLYHQQEALWNQIFEEYMGGTEKLESVMLDHFGEGFIDLGA